MPLIHRRSARVIGDAFDGHIPSRIPNDSFHNADVNLLSCQSAALLDMQLEIRENIAALSAARGQTSGIAANERNPFAKRLSTPRSQTQVFFAQLTRNRTAPLQPTFLVLENQDLQRVAQCDVAVGQSLCDLDRAQRSDNPIVVATLWN